MRMIAWVVWTGATSTANIQLPTTRATVTTVSIGARPSGTRPICTIARRNSSRAVSRSLSKAVRKCMASQGSLLSNSMAILKHKSIPRAQGHTFKSIMGTQVPGTYIHIKKTSTITHTGKIVAPLISLIMCTSPKVSKSTSTL